MKGLRARLSAVGVKSKFLNEVVLPSWWDDSIALSNGGFREAASIICAHLGFSLTSLLDEKKPLELKRASGVKFKKAQRVTDQDVCLTTQYALAVARAAASAYLEQPPAGSVPTPEEWRLSLLAASDRPWVCLRHVLHASWKLGIPVLHLRNLPPGAKKPDALTTMVGDRPVIVILNGRKSPSWVAFIVAHELGHIHHEHLKSGETWVDEKLESRDGDKEETEANDYASLLLTGHSDIGLHSNHSLGPKQLADAARGFGQRYRIAPGVAALNYGFNTGSWALANGAVSLLESDDDAAADLEAAMMEHLDGEALSEDTWEWIKRATGVSE